MQEIFLYPDGNCRVFVTRRPTATIYIRTVAGSALGEFLRAFAPFPPGVVFRYHVRHHPEPHMAEFALKINGSEHKVDVAPDTPLLWVLRDTLQMTGTKFGCGAGLCGACTVHVEGNATRSCSMPVSQANGKSVTTIEGLSANGPTTLQQAWIAEEVPQCGYCQVGQIMTAAALLSKTPQPTDDQITQAMAGNICRCGTYDRIRKAIHRAAGGGQ